MHVFGNRYLFIFISGPMFDQELEAGVNEQINYELSAHYTYLSMVRRSNKKTLSIYYFVFHLCVCVCLNTKRINTKISMANHNITGQLRSRNQSGWG